MSIYIRLKGQGIFFLRDKQNSLIIGHARPTPYKECNQICLLAYIYIYAERQPESHFHVMKFGCDVTVEDSSNQVTFLELNVRIKIQK